MKTTRTPKTPKTPKTWDLEDPQVLARLLEGPIDRAAFEFLTEGAALLSVNTEDDFDSAINNLEDTAASKKNWVLDGLEEQAAKCGPHREAIDKFVHRAVTRRTVTAYLFGLAVGRRLAPRGLAPVKGDAR